MIDLWMYQESISDLQRNVDDRLQRGDITEMLVMFYAWIVETTKQLMTKTAGIESKVLIHILVLPGKPDQT